MGTYTKELIAALRNVPDITLTTFDDVKDIPKDADLVHITHFDPFFLTLPLTLRAPMVITIHDLIPLVYPSHFPRGIRGELKWQIQRLSASRAARVITDSQASKRDIVRFMQMKEDRIDVVPLAPRAAFGPVANSKTLTEIMSKYSLPMHFALYVGDVNWNKNVIGLLSAWSEYVLRNTFARGNKLVLVGSAFLDPNLAEAKEIQAVIEQLEIGDSVMRVGFVPEEDLEALYTLSSVTVVPSYHEGFGFAVLESLACGGVVVAANASSIPEIAGPSILVDPQSSSSIAHGIARVMEMKPIDRENLVKKGIAWSKNFSWDTAAKQTIEAYKKVISNK